jgi:Flp pilus assembly protein TadG
MDIAAKLTAPRSPLTRGDDRGASTLEMVILFPALLLLIFGIVQGAFWYHARNVALAAATSGLQVASSESGSARAGQETAAEFLDRAGGTGILPVVQISADRSATVATVTVTGRAPSFVPGLPGLPVTQTASGPVERFTTAGGQ